MSKTNNKANNLNNVLIEGSALQEANIEYNNKVVKQLFWEVDTAENKKTPKIINKPGESINHPNYIEVDPEKFNYDFLYLGRTTNLNDDSNHTTDLQTGYLGNQYCCFLKLKFKESGRYAVQFKNPIRLLTKFSVTSFGENVEEGVRKTNFRNALKDCGINFSDDSFNDFYNGIGGAHLDSIKDPRHAALAVAEIRHIYNKYFNSYFNSSTDLVDIWKNLKFQAEIFEVFNPPSTQSKEDAYTKRNNYRLLLYPASFKLSQKETETDSSYMWYYDKRKSETTNKFCFINWADYYGRGGNETLLVCPTDRIAFTGETTDKSGTWPWVNASKAYDFKYGIYTSSISDLEITGVYTNYSYSEEIEDYYSVQYDSTWKDYPGDNFVLDNVAQDSSIYNFALYNAQATDTPNFHWQLNTFQEQPGICFNAEAEKEYYIKLTSDSILATFTKPDQGQSAFSKARQLVPNHNSATQLPFLVALDTFESPLAGTGTDSISDQEISGHENPLCVNIYKREYPEITAISTDAITVHNPNPYVVQTWISGNNSGDFQSVDRDGGPYSKVENIDKGKSFKIEALSKKLPANSSICFRHYMSEESDTNFPNLKADIPGWAFAYNSTIDSRPRQGLVGEDVNCISTGKFSTDSSKLWLVVDSIGEEYTENNEYYTPDSVFAGWLTKEDSNKPNKPEYNNTINYHDFELFIKIEATNKTFKREYSHIYTNLQSSNPEEDRPQSRFHFVFPQEDLEKLNGKTVTVYAYGNARQTDVGTSTIFLSREDRTYANPMTGMVIYDTNTGLYKIAFKK